MQIQHLFNQYHHDSYESPYNERPMAARALVVPETLNTMPKLMQKLAYVELVRKQKLIEEWDTVSIQITIEICVCA